MKRYLIIAVLFFLASAGTASAQKLAVKTNALYWGTATPNLGLEYAMADRWTLELEGGYNPWTFDSEKNMKIKHWLVSPEVRYWFCESFLGHFVGINGNYTLFNISGIPTPGVFIDLSSNTDSKTDLKNSRVQGWAVGAGVTYGYAFPIARRWNMELTLGYGIWYTEYGQYESRKCGLFQQDVQKWALGPTALGVSFMFMIK
ncbi:MAG: DUF3575 domain-containing protein [Bacteroidales bacterium]|nr:DUF3575 domain-containing protein [Bacteroidales bacterium]